MQQITDIDFEPAVSRGKVLVDFYSTTCPPCKALAPILEKLDNEMSNVTFLKINVDTDSGMASDLGIASVPTLVLFEDGDEIDRKTGILPSPVLRAWISG